MASNQIKISLQWTIFKSLINEKAMPLWSQSHDWWTRVYQTLIELSKQAQERLEKMSL